MQIAPWRLALTGGAILVLGALGGGMVAAAAMPASPAPATSSTGTGSSSADDAAGALDDILLAVDPTGTAPNTASTPNAASTPLQRLQALRNQFGIRAGFLRNRLVHATITAVGKDGKLVTVELDRGTISSTGGGSLAIAEQGGSTVTVSTSDQTKVRVDGKAASLGDLKSGQEVIVASTLDGGSATARLVVVPPAKAAGAPSNGGGNGS